MIFYIYLYITSRIICFCKRRIFGVFNAQNSDATKKHKKIEKRLKKGLTKGGEFGIIIGRFEKADNRTAKKEEQKGMKKCGGSRHREPKSFSKKTQKTVDKMLPMW